MTLDTVIVWFRRDLRLADNPALSAALEAAREIIPFYLWAPEDEGEWPPGAAQRWWLHESLASLQRELEKRGSRLVVGTGQAEKSLPALVELTGAQGVFWNRLYEPALAARDERVALALGRMRVAACSFKASLLAEPWELATKTGAPYRVFTPFHRALTALGDPPPPLPVPPGLKPPARWPQGRRLEELGLMPERDWHATIAEAWTPGESGAHGRLEAFADHALKGYATERDRPAHDGTARISPWLHHGELSPRQAWHAIASRRSEAPARDVEAWLRELAWREFAHHVLHHFPRTPTEPMQEKYARFPWRERYGRWLSAWQRGRSGIPLVDAGMRQLWATGWMHNRVRMVAASLLVKNVRAPWQEGARWFWDTLVDADLANNTLGWQWVAGCGADAAPYFRIFNPVTQGEKFDPDGAYVKRWVPELADLPPKYVHRPWECGAKGYPAPIVDLKASRAEALAALSTLD